MSWFDTIKQGARNFLTLGKNALDWGQKSLGKVHNFASKANNFLNQKGTKDLVKGVSSFMPSAGDAFKSFKKYGHIAQNVSKIGSDLTGRLQRGVDGGLGFINNELPNRLTSKGKGRNEPSIERTQRQKQVEPEYDF